MRVKAEIKSANAAIYALNGDTLWQGNIRNLWKVIGQKRYIIVSVKNIKYRQKNNKAQGNYPQKISQEQNIAVTSRQTWKLREKFTKEQISYLEVLCPPKVASVEEWDRLDRLAVEALEKNVFDFPKNIFS